MHSPGEKKRDLRNPSVSPFPHSYPFPPFSIKANAFPKLGGFLFLLAASHTPEERQHVDSADTHQDIDDPGNPA